jgi:putative sigma-54 modulation protein
MYMSSKLIISGHHLEITPALEDHVKEKFGKIQKMFEIVASMHVSLTMDKSLQVAKAEVRVAGDPNPMFAEAATHDMYLSIDEIEHKILAQVSRYHDKLKDHERK